MWWHLLSDQTAQGDAAQFVVLFDLAGSVNRLIFDSNGAADGGATLIVDIDHLAAIVADEMMIF